MKKSKLLKKMIIIVITLLLILTFSQIKLYAYGEIQLASGVIDPNEFNPGDIQDAFNGAGNVTDMGATIISIIRIIGIIVTVICLMLIGIKYMTGSVEEKADYKKSMIPYLIGVFIFFGLSQLIPVIIDFAGELN